VSPRSMPDATFVAPEVKRRRMSRNQTSLYAKIDIFILLYSKTPPGLNQSKKNVKLPAREVFRSLGATPFSLSISSKI
jgi:hypothetical protein